MLTDRQLFFLLSTGSRPVDVGKGLIVVLLPLPDLGWLIGIAHGIPLIIRWRVSSQCSDSLSIQRMQCSSVTLSARVLALLLDV